MAKRKHATPARHSFMYRNGLTLVFLALMAASLVGHALTGHAQHNQALVEHGQPPQSVREYVTGPEFSSTLFENWESEFLQMALFVLFTVWLRQRGASESRKLEPEEEAPDPKVPKAQQPWPMRVGGLWERLYQHSLSGALLLLFVLSFGGHLLASWRLHADEQRLHGEAVSPLSSYVSEPAFWFESFQNWQSEFMAVVALCLLSIYLREKDSPQSKAMTARHGDTGA